jgi:hypothetical protein
MSLTDSLSFQKDNYQVLPTAASTEAAVSIIDGMSCYTAPPVPQTFTNEGK